jgi:hypothetical protein
MINRDTTLESMAHWMQAWKALGRWQALNARLSRDAAPLTSGWAKRCSTSCRHSGVPAGASTPPQQAGS